ncbi:dethiobiotin synthetase [Desulfofundulus luciae]|uniref:ATP-dependent dethiobiotin synthetase BioD n=1 Tax=Desulfofundulus luciae TaxID=74702 RepID=A0ABU0B1K6_9FIRM|nr:dethiobiotin synthase [Desulfofundulus luciae]MDQ0285801.1 dethiobiotin synthetase [Desulfofundulus luciae]
MGRGCLVTGTDTGVGKTVITAALVGVWRRRGIDAVAIKPVQSGAIEANGQLVPEDVVFYRHVASLPQSIDELNLYRFTPAVSPHLAAKLSGERVEPSRVVDFCRKVLQRHELVLIEGAGGLCVPLSGPDFTVADLARELSLPLLVVARPGLGSINHTVLTVAYAQNRGLPVAGIIINGLKAEEAGPAEKDNPGIIAAMTGVSVLGMVPYLPGVSVEKGSADGLVETVENTVVWEDLVSRICGCASTG